MHSVPPLARCWERPRCQLTHRKELSVGLKVDSSFLKFVTMGAVGTRRVQELLAGTGFRPIELERYSRSNKIWATKVKRLRLPDLLCVQTGLRVEVRAKSKLAIKMSDAENNPNRRWNTGLADRDVIAFVHVREMPDGRIEAAPNAEFFWAEDLRITEGQSRLGPPKSASEGAERDREWASIVAKENGVVEIVDRERARFTVRFQTGRRHTYQLNGKSAYLSEGDGFVANSQFLAGIPGAKAILQGANRATWDPRALLESDSPVDRYVGVKALGVVGEAVDIQRILPIAERDPDGRVAVEAAATLVRLEEPRGVDLLREAINNPAFAYLRMEALLALGEFRETPFAPQCVRLLVETASRDDLRDDEARQAAIWGLGKDGLGAYHELMDFLDTESEDELVHATCAFGADAGNLVAELVAMLLNERSSQRQRASASFILARTIPEEITVPSLLARFNSVSEDANNWILATLGQMSPNAVVPLATPELAARLAPLHLTAPETNWTRSEPLVASLAFVRKQTV